MANGINYLIATGGGYTPPAFDYAQARMGRAAVQGQETMNALRQRQLEREPERWEMEQAQHGLQEQALQIRSLAVKLQEQLLTMGGGNEDVEIPLPDGKYKIKGKGRYVNEVLEGIKQFPDQINDPNFGPWAASKGVSLEEIKPIVTPSETQKLLEQLNAMPANHPNRPWLEARLKKLTEATGRTIRVNPETGEVEIIEGPIGEVPRKPKELTSEDKSRLATIRTTIGIMDELRDMPNLESITGPIEGAWKQLKIKFVEDKDAQAAANRIESLITIAYGFSGKQISYREMEMLKKAILPRITQPDENFLTTLKFARDYLASAHDNLIDVHKESGGYVGGLKKIKEVETKGNKIGRFTVEVEK